MNLHFDPGQIDRFKAEIRRIPGYPAGEDLPIREMVFEPNVFFRLPVIRRRLTLGDLFLFLEWDRETLWARVNGTLPGARPLPDANR